MAKTKTVQHSSKFTSIQKWYSVGAWSLNMVKNAVVKGWITEDEFKEITGEVYE